MPPDNRSDCVRSTEPVHCPLASVHGYSSRTARRGNFVRYTRDHLRLGRVVGKVTCEGVSYLEVIEFTSLVTANVDWVDPKTVEACYIVPPYRMLEFVFSDWEHRDPEDIFRAAARESVPDLDDTNRRMIRVDSI